MIEYQINELIGDTMKKVITLIILFLLIFTMTGCKKSETLTTDSTDSQVADSTESTEAIETVAASTEAATPTATATRTSPAPTASTTAPSIKKDVPTSAPVQSTEPQPAKATDFVANLKISKSTSQIIVVSATGTHATVSMHEIQNGEWTQIISTSGRVGSDGVGTASEYCSKTPVGIFGLSLAFGVANNPGTALPYTKLNDSHYWVDDVSSAYYNRFVSTDDPSIAKDWNSAEHLIDYPGPYNYAIAIDYNLARVPGNGSAIFLHCSNGNATAGCVSVLEPDMVFILKHIKNGCVILIDTENNIYTH